MRMNTPNLNENKNLKIANLIPYSSETEHTYMKFILISSAAYPLDSQ